MPDTIIINRLDLRKMLVLLKVSEKSIDELEARVNKQRRHINAVVLAGMLQKLGLKQDDIKNIFLRIGISDISINNILNAVDEQKITASFGRIVNLTLSE